MNCLPAFAAEAVGFEVTDYSRSIVITFPIWADDFSAGFGVPFSSLTLTVCDCDDDEM